MIDVWFNTALAAIAEFLTAIAKSSSRKVDSCWHKAETDVSCSSQDKGIRKLAEWSATFLRSHQGVLARYLARTLPAFDTQHSRYSMKNDELLVTKDLSDCGMFTCFALRSVAPWLGRSARILTDSASELEC